MVFLFYKNLKSRGKQRWRTNWSINLMVLVQTHTGSSPFYCSLLLSYKYLKKNYEQNKFAHALYPNHWVTKLGGKMLDLSIESPEFKSSPLWWSRYIDNSF